jgi:hypothetical protein
MARKSTWMRCCFGSVVLVYFHLLPTLMIASLLLVSKIKNGTDV